VREGSSSRRYYVSGVVQGVGYRFFVERVAQRLGVAGYTRNLRDGRVEIYAIGSADSLEELQGELERGPSAASVTDVAVQDAPFEGQFASGFSIEYDA